MNDAAVIHAGVRHRTTILVVLGWMLLALLSCVQSYLFALYSNTEMVFTWASVLPWVAIETVNGVALTFAALQLSRRVSIGRKDWAAAMLTHVTAGVALALVAALPKVVLQQMVEPNRPGGLIDLYLYIISKHFHVDLLIYLLAVGLAHALQYYALFRDRELSSARLSADLATARLDALRNQLNPHFLFNTLHAISSLIRDDPRAADRMVSRLSDLLRTSLETADQHEVPLHQELDFLAPYIEIEQTRFQDKLTVSVVAAPDTLDALVPSMLLQPLVENAVRHGMVRPGRRSIIVRALRVADRLELQVCDDGSGLPEGGARDGIGLANTRARLFHLYGDDHQLELRPREVGGLAVVIGIPFREAAQPVPA